MARAVLITLLFAPALFAVEIPILAYHQVVAVPETSWAASIEDFTDQMQFLSVAGYNVVPIADLDAYLGGKRESLPANPVVLTVDDGWADAYTTIHPILKRFRYPWSLYVYPRILSRGTTYLKWAKVLELSKAGVDIQGHTMSHAHLNHQSHPKMTDAEYTAWLKKELADSRTAIEQKVGKSVRYLAYPYGEYDEAVKEATGKYGYAIGLTSDHGINTKTTNPLQLFRYAIAIDTTFAKFLHKGLGTLPIKLRHASPANGKVMTPSTVSAVIANAHELDPSTVRIALLGEKATGQFDPQTGRVSLSASNLTRQRQHVVVWGDRKSDGKKMAGTWTFYTTPEAQARYEKK
jgi:peptidoglycan/xylan/chitin deacetylase (PgdA/CDA1 family)